MKDYTCAPSVSARTIGITQSEIQILMLPLHPATPIVLETPAWTGIRGRKDGRRTTFSQNRSIRVTGDTSPSVPPDLDDYEPSDHGELYVERMNYNKSELSFSWT